MTNSLKFISFYNLFDSVIMKTFESRRFIFIRDSILSYLFSRLFKQWRIKEYSKTKNCCSEWLYVYFIKRHIDSRSFDKLIDHWICVFFDNERYYRYMIDNQFLFVNLMIDSLFWSLERLSFFDFENHLLSEYINFMIKLFNNYFEYLFCSESLTGFLKNLINVLKESITRVFEIIFI